MKLSNPDDNSLIETHVQSLPTRIRKQNWRRQTICFLRTEHVNAISFKFSLRHGWETGEDQFFVEASQDDWTGAERPNRVYFRPELINTGHVFFVFLETVSCIACQYEIGSLTLRDHKSHCLTAAVDWTYSRVGTHKFTQYWMEPDQSEKKWKSVTWEIFITCHTTSVKKKVDGEILIGRIIT